MTQPRRTREEMRQIKHEKLQEKKRNDYYGDNYAMPPECDACCRFRSCYNKYHNKGSFAIGRGYTSYYTDFHPACGTRLAHGCPPRNAEPGDSFNMLDALKWMYDEVGRLRDPKVKLNERRKIKLWLRKTLSCMIAWHEARNENAGKQ